MYVNWEGRDVHCRAMRGEKGWWERYGEGSIGEGRGETGEREWGAGRDGEKDSPHCLLMSQAECSKLVTQTTPKSQDMYKDKLDVRY